MEVYLFDILIWIALADGSRRGERRMTEALRFIDDDVLPGARDCRDHIPSRHVIDQRRFPSKLNFWLFHVSTFFHFHFTTMTSLAPLFKLCVTILGVCTCTNFTAKGFSGIASDTKRSAIKWKLFVLRRGRCLNFNIMHITLPEMNGEEDTVVKSFSRCLNSSSNRAHEKKRSHRRLHHDPRH